ncbi:MAG: hypothetical protein E6I78_01895, partial [Chloroflexi bacterium]
IDPVRARLSISIALSLSLLALGGVLAVSGTSSSGLPVPGVKALEAVGAQVFPKDPQHPYYVECVNLPEKGVAPPGGNDYSACPLTDRLRARLVQKQTHLCPCELNPSTTREINAQPRLGGGRLTVVLYQGHAQIELIVVSVAGKLLVDRQPAKGSFEMGADTTADAPKPTPTPTIFAPSAAGSRVLTVPWYRQAFELSCESASLRMALAYEGIATTDQAILDIVGADLSRATFVNGALRWGDPYASFVGNVNGSEIALTGYGMYYPTVVKAATQLGGHILAAGEGMAPNQVYEAVLAGHPVVTWVTYQWVLLRRQDYVAFNGRTIPYAGPGEHAVTIVGVDPNRVLVNNPWSGPEWVSKALFERIFLTYNQMGVVLA